MRIKTTKKLHTEITEIHFQMLDDIQEKKGFLTTSEVVRYCFSEIHKKEFPDYIRLQQSRIDNKETPEERAKRLVEQEELKDSTKKNRTVTEKSKICEALGGEIETINSFPHCRYTIYQEAPGKKINSVPMVEPLETLTEETIRLQYRDLMGNAGENKLQDIK